MAAAVETPAVFRPHTQRRVFRTVIEALARPGRWLEVDADIGEAPTWLGVLAAMCDASISLADPLNLLSARDRRFLASPARPVQDADIIVYDAAAAPPNDFSPKRGALISPEDGATLVLAATRSEGGRIVTVAGPGVDGERVMATGDMHPDWLDRRAEWVGLFPLGVDMVVCAPGKMLALPRSSRIDLPSASKGAQL